MKQVAVVLVGIGGYGSGYVDQLLQAGRDDVVIAGVVDPYPNNYEGIARLRELQIPIYNTLNEFYAEHKADLAVISSPIHFHCEQTTTALANGSHVLCEKPVSAVVQEALKMKEAQEHADKLVGIGYQWSFSEPILSLKQDILAGKLGHPELLKTLVLWPRNLTYYSRGWAGRMKAPDGSWVLDSVANNATAHFLHNMFFILGDRIDHSASLKQVEAELYRANRIENFDTCAVRAVTTGGTEILFYASHAVKTSIGPIFEYRFSDAVVRYNEGSSEPNITVKYNDGTWKSYGNPKLNPRRKLWMMVDAVRGEGIVPCGIDASLTQTICINGAQESMPEIKTLPEEIVIHDPKSDTIYEDHLEELFVHLYQGEILPHQDNVDWAAAGKVVNLENYRYYPSLGLDS